MKTIASALAFFLCLSTVYTDGTSQPMPPKNVNANKSSNKTLFDNISVSKINSKFAAALQMAGLADTLKTQGPFTVFAPTNTAFIKLPKGSLAVLMKPENKAVLSNILSYHLVPGRLPIETLLASIDKNGGTFTTKTIQGGEITFSSKGKSLFITDQKGGISKVLVKNPDQTNGFMYLVETVLMPGK